MHSIGEEAPQSRLERVRSGGQEACVETQHQRPCVQRIGLDAERLLHAVARGADAEDFYRPVCLQTRAQQAKLDLFPRQVHFPSHVPLEQAQRADPRRSEEELPHSPGLELLAIRQDARGGHVQFAKGERHRWPVKEERPARPLPGLNRSLQLSRGIGEREPEAPAVRSGSLERLVRGPEPRRKLQGERQPFPGQLDGEGARQCAERARASSPLFRVAGDQDVPVALSGDTACPNDLDPIRPHVKADRTACDPELIRHLGGV